jgi:hypothetical protein
MIWWFSAHENSLPIRARRKRYMVIPFQNFSGKLRDRIGVKTWWSMLDQMRRAKQTYVIKKNGNLILMAKQKAATDFNLAPAKRSYKHQQGLKRLSKSTDVPIAILKPMVASPKKYDVIKYSKKMMPSFFRKHMSNKLTFNNLF